MRQGLRYRTLRCRVQRLRRGHCPEAFGIKTVSSSNQGISVKHPHQHWVFATTLTLIFTFVNGCASTGLAQSERSWATNVAAFEREIRELQSALEIPGLAYVIVNDDAPVASNAFGTMQGAPSEAFTPRTPLRIASVTKALTAVIALQLVEEGRLNLDAPARHYVPDLKLPDNVLVRHLLTHTSEGRIGEEYVYSTTRYAMLGPIIEAIAGHNFDQTLRERVLERAGMQAYPSPALGAHAGLVSTAADMGAFLTSFGSNRLLKSSSLERLALPSRSTSGDPLPVSLGFFTQTVQGQHVMWSFGQDDPEHSGALLVHLPERGLSLFVLANANVLSDPFRLLMGDVSKSPFAMSFLRLFAFSGPGDARLRPERDAVELSQELTDLEERTAYRYRDELIGWALIDLWTGRVAAAQCKFDMAASRYPNPQRPDPVVHFAALRLPEEQTKEAAIRIGEQLLSRHPGNRWMLLVQGYLLQQRAQFEKSSAHFHRILDLPNQEPDFMDRLFKAWSWMALAQMSEGHDPNQARRYLQQIIASGITGNTLEEAKRRLDHLKQTTTNGER